MQLWIASSNKGKIREFTEILLNTELEIHSQDELPAYAAPPENGNSFTENARIKAKYLRALKKESWVVADDSGLEVAGLNNLPGIHSARYAGPKSSDIENVAKVLKMLSFKSPKNREAQFQCALVAFSPEGEEFCFTGELKGSISRGQKGTAGFGFDSIFIPKGETKTLGELGLLFKNKVSHRAKAIKKFCKTYLETK